MRAQTLAQLIPVLQVAVGPVILISGVGLLLLSMTTRFRGIVDRSRALAALVRHGDEGERRRAERQIPILWRRARLARQAIALAATSALTASILVIVLFVAAVTGLEIGWVVVTLFMLCLAALVASLVTFIREVNESLGAIKVELFDEASR